MNQLVLLDFETRLSRINKTSAPLVKLNESISCEIFRYALEAARTKP